MHDSSLEIIFKFDTYVAKTEDLHPPETADAFGNQPEIELISLGKQRMLYALGKEERKVPVHTTLLRKQC